MKTAIVWIASVCCVASSAALATPQRSTDVFSCYKTSPESQPDWAAISRDYAAKRFRTGCHPEYAVQPVAARKLSLANAQAVPAAAAVVPVSSSPATSDFIWLVRKDFADVGIFAKPDSNKDADGAEIAWSRNNITQDNIWQVDGLFALAYSYRTNDYSSSFIGVSIASYLKVNKELHSAASASDSNNDALTAGGSAEFGFNSPFFRGADYLRARWSETQDNIAGTRTSQIAGEWIPTYLRINREIPGLFLTYNFRPEARVEYDTRSEGAMPIGFSGLNQSLRVGPQVKLLFRFTDFGGTLPAWAKNLASLSGSVTYHWWSEVYSGNQASWLDSTIKYNLDQDGNIALALTYRNGRNEETAKKTDLVKISLNFKTCSALFGYSGSTCQKQDE
jgi:hypothetical protein